MRVEEVALGRGDFIAHRGVEVTNFRRELDLDIVRIATGGTYAVNKLEFSHDGKRLLGAFRVGQAFQLAWLDLETGDLTPLTSVSSYFRFALSPL